MTLRLYGVADVAEALELSRERVRQLVAGGLIQQPDYEHDDGIRVRRYWTREQVDALVAQVRRPAGRPLRVSDATRTGLAEARAQLAGYLAPAKR